MTPPRLDRKPLSPFWQGDYTPFTPGSPYSITPYASFISGNDFGFFTPNLQFRTFPLLGNFPIPGAPIPLDLKGDKEEAKTPGLWQFKMPPPPPPSPLGSTEDWVRSLRGVANQIERLDLDFYKLPVNRGTGLTRFSEYTPRLMRPKGPTLAVPEGTTARAHGEIRPVEGSEESLITRVMWDFDPNVIYMQDSVAPNLEINGAAAVDPPIITFDKTFPSPKKTVLNLSGGDVTYENPLETGDAMTTPFDSTAPAPPNGHQYWMFHFQPVNKNLISGLEEAISEGATAPAITPGLGALYLWAFLPEAGLYQDADFDAYKIPFNTFPRRFGDLIDMLTFHADFEKRRQRLADAPLINPNTEYIDSDGKRQRIPDDPKKVEEINKERAEKDRPPLGRSRGGIIDWIFTDLAKDWKRLRGMKESELPYGNVHLRMREGFLDLPIGKIHLDPKTDIQMKYYLRKVVTDDPLRPEAKLAMHLEISNFRLEGTKENPGVDLKIGDMVVKAEGLVAKKAVIDIPDFGLFRSGPTSTADFIEGGSWQKPDAMTVNLEGVEVTGLQIGKENKDWNVEITSASIGKLDLTRDFRVWKAHMEKFSLKDLNVELNRPGLPIHKIHVPETLLPNSDFDLNQDVLGRIEKLGLVIPELPSNLEVKLGFGGDLPVEVKVSTSGLLKNIDYHYEKKGEKPTHRLGVELPSVKIAVEGSVLKMPIQSTAQAAISNGTFGIDEKGTHLEGDLDLSAKAATEVIGFGRGETKLGSFTLAKGSPRISNLGGQGHFRLDFMPDGWRLSNPQHEKNPLNIEFDAGIKFTHRPKVEDSPVGGLKESEIVKTEFDLQSAHGLVRDLREMAYHQGAVSGELTDLEIGSIFLNGLKGSGKIWAPLAIWGFVRLNLPSFGGSPNASGPDAKRPSASIPLPPDPTPLLKQIPSGVMAQLKKDNPGLNDAQVLEKFKGENFFLLDDVRYHNEGSGEWSAFLGNLVLNIQEQPVKDVPFRGSFGMLRIPGIQLKKNGTDYKFEIDDKNLFQYIFLNEPPRGGSFCIVKWPANLEKANLCPTTK